MVKFRVLIFLFVVTSVSSSPTISWQNAKTFVKLLRTLQRNPNIQSGFSNLQHNLKRAATTGVMIGTIKAEKKMESNLIKLVNEVVASLQKSNIQEASNKLKKIEVTMERDKKAVEILRNAMDLSLKTQNTHDHPQAALKKVKKDDSTNKTQKNNKKLKISSDKTAMMKELNSKIQNHLKFMRDKVGLAVQETMKSIAVKKKSEISSTPATITSQSIHMNDIFNRDTAQLPQFHVQVPLWPVYPFDVESFYRFRRQNDVEKDEKENQVMNESEEEDFDDGFGPPTNNGGGGGFAGLLGKPPV
jgi:hypothetical protein